MRWCLPSEAQTGFSQGGGQIKGKNNQLGSGGAISKQTSPRVFYLASAKRLPTRLYAARRLERHVPTTHPHVATNRLLLPQSLLSLVFIIPGNVGSLIDFFSFAVWLFYGGTMVALLVLRFTQPDLKRPYKVMTPKAGGFCSGRRISQRVCCTTAEKDRRDMSRGPDSRTR